jgi:UDP-2,3-diacylglucosamine pyrophosphatase LpxH
MDNFVGEYVGDIKMVDDYMLGDCFITHGDRFDSSVVLYGGLLMKIGDVGYDILLELNHWHVNLCKKLHLPQTETISHKIKRNVKQIVNYVNRYEELAVSQAKHKHCAIVCLGHSHSAKDININGIRYINSGCWVTDSPAHYIVENNCKFELKEYR